MGKTAEREEQMEGRACQTPGEASSGQITGALREMRLRKNQPSKPAPKEEASSEPKWFLSRGW